MPIDIDEFERAAEEELLDVGSSPEQAVLEFLSFKPENAYTLSEIQSSTDLPLLTVADVLSRLASRGVVRHKGQYWAISSDHRRDRETEPAEEVLE